MNDTVEPKETVETEISLKELYEQRVAQGQFMRDLAQEKALNELDKLAHEIGMTKQFKKGKGTGLVARLLGKGQTNERGIKGIYLYGPVGRGKSCLMDLFYEAVSIDKKKRIHFHEFMSDVHDALHVYRQQGINSDKAIPILAEQLVKESNLLCFDELYITDIADAMIVGRLFTEMFAAGLILVSTSNWAPKDLYKDGIQRDRFIPFIEQIQKHMIVQQIAGKIDYRLERLRTHSVYFTPVGAETRAELDKIFEELTEHDHVEKKTITVKGHLLHIPKASSHVARFTFQQLCGQPKGASDYLSLARHYECIVLEGVPVFESDQSDLVKRFILMVDAFYEKKVKLILSADAQPAELYKKGALKAEFARTASRLLEMQSLEYLESTHRNV